MDSESEIIAGKILYAIKNGAKRFREIERVTNLSSTTITKYTHDLEEEGLLILKSDKDRRKIIYQLNEAKMDEINKLINAYLEHEKKELKEKIERAMHYIEFTEEEKKEIAEFVEKLKKKFGL